MVKWRVRSKREVPCGYLVTWGIIVCVVVYAWKEAGCPGLSECGLCRTFSPDFILNPLAVSSSADDFTKLVNLKNFTFLMNNYACNGTDLLLLVLVHSDPYNYEKRFTIRSTWGKAIGNRSKLLFLVGIPNSTLVQRNLEEENDINEDLVQGNFADTYRNLTYKHVMALKWTKYFCPNTRYVLKTDDDVFVNSPSFLRYISHKTPRRRLMRCLVVTQSYVRRSSRSKWKVLPSEYNFRLYPTYCLGFAILYSPDVVATLYAKAQVANYFWIDDVFVTGMLGLAANYTPTSFGKYMFWRSELEEMLKTNKKEFSYLLGPWNLAVKDVRALWEKAFKAGLLPDLEEEEERS